MTNSPQNELLEAAKRVMADFDIQIHGGRATDYMKHWLALRAAILNAEKDATS